MREGGMKKKNKSRRVESGAKERKGLLHVGGHQQQKHFVRVRRRCFIGSRSARFGRKSCFLPLLLLLLLLLLLVVLYCKCDDVRSLLDDPLAAPVTIDRPVVC